MSSQRDISVHPCFEGALLHAHRAGQKIKGMQSTAAAYANSGIRCFTTQVQETSTRVYVLADPFPFDADFVVGEVIRALRGSLDYAVSALYRLHGLRDDSAHVRWHTGKDRIDLENSIKGTLVKHGFESIAPFFLERMNHTEASGSPIFRLNQIDRANKHRALNVVVTSTVTPLPDVSSDHNGVMQYWRDNVLSVKPGEIAFFDLPAPPEHLDPQSQLRRTVSITFGASEVFPNANVILTLSGLHKLVVECLHEFQDACRVAYPEKFA